ncbi:MAG: ABC transporter permease, partial [Gemmatimonadales bacterium]
SDGSDEMSPWRRNPPLNEQEANRIRALPSIEFLVMDEGSSAPVEYGNRELESVPIRGRGPDWIRVGGGDIDPGRSFTRIESEARTRVVVVNQRLAEEMFGQLDPIGKRLKISGVPYQVIGVYIPPPDIFGEGNRPEAIIPHRTFEKYVPYWRGWMDFLVSPSPNVTVDDAIDDVTATLRGMRGLRPAEENNFSIVTQDRLLDSWNQVTGMFFLVMIALSSVGLMVGGVGVVAIMMISVTRDRSPQGARCKATRDPVAVLGRGGDADAGGWRMRHVGGRVCELHDCDIQPPPRQDSCVLGRRCPRHVGPHRRALRSLPRSKGRAPRSRGGPAVRVGHGVHVASFL